MRGSVAVGMHRVAYILRAVFYVKTVELLPNIQKCNLKVTKEIAFFLFL